MKNVRDENALQYIASAVGVFLIVGFTALGMGDASYGGFHQGHYFVFGLTVLIPMAMFTIWLAVEKGYDPTSWALLSALFTVLAFLVALGLPDRVAHPMPLIYESIEKADEKDDVCRRCGGRLARLTGDCLKCGSD